MKKSLFVLPVFVALLTACQSNEPAKVPSDTELSNATPLNLDTEIQQTEMPSHMGSMPSYTPPTYSAPVPVAQPAYTPTIPQAPTVPTYQEPRTSSHTETAGNCQIVRDGSSPVYAQIQKGCYTDATYTVSKGDTIFLVAYLAGKSVDEIARLNRLSPPYALQVGQNLRVK